MTIQTLTSFVKVRGTAAERTAFNLSDIPQYQEIEFFETDTDATYLGSRDGWAQTGASGAARVSVSGSADIGNLPHNLFAASAFVGAADAATVTLSNLESYDVLVLTVSAFTATALNITASIDGTTFVAVLPTKDSLATTPAAIAAVGTYFIRGKFKSLKLTQSGAGGVTAQFAHGVM